MPSIRYTFNWSTSNTSPRDFNRQGQPDLEAAKAKYEHYAANMQAGGEVEAISLYKELWNDDGTLAEAPVLLMNRARPIKQVVRYNQKK